MGLLELSWKYPTDKGRLKHGYLETYEGLLGPHVGRGIRLLELGVLHGFSLLMWRDYLGNAEVHGADCNHRPRLLDGGRNKNVLFHRVDCGDWEALEREFGGMTFDVVIDDASHQLSQQVVSYEVLLPLVRPGGVYVIEDVLPPTLSYFQWLAPPRMEVVDLRAVSHRGGEDSMLLVFRA